MFKRNRPPATLPAQPTVTDLLDRDVKVEFEIGSFVLGVLAGILLTIAIFILIVMFAAWQAKPAHAATFDKPATCLIVVNRAQTNWRYATRAGRGEIVRRWIPFGLTQIAGDCAPATTRQQPTN